MRNVQKIEKGLRIGFERNNVNYVQTEVANIFKP